MQGAEKQQLCFTNYRDFGETHIWGNKSSEDISHFHRLRFDITSVLTELEADLCFFCRIYVTRNPFILTAQKQQKEPYKIPTYLLIHAHLRLNLWDANSDKINLTPGNQSSATFSNQEFARK